MSSIQWYERGPYQGYGIAELSDGTLDIYRENGICIGNAGNISLAVQMMQEDE